jgi:hypothetical protein
MRQLVFIHGRSQEGKDSVSLKQTWVDAWRKGLEASGLTVPLADEDIRFPYYGDTLDQLVKGRSTEEAAQVIVRGTEENDDEQTFIRSYLNEVEKQTNLTDDMIRAHSPPEVIARGPQNWGWVQGILSGLDRHVPGASGASVALFTKDVYHYLKNPGIRDPIDTGVRNAFTSGVETVVVSHSLGTVVAFNVLRRDGEIAGWKVPLFVTLGSPLAVKVIKKSLAPINHPKCATKWFNAMDDRDVVSLYPLNADHFNVSPSIENKTDVNNDTSNRHGISGYLSDPVVARRIYDAVTSP